MVDNGLEAGTWHTLLLSYTRHPTTQQYLLAIQYDTAISATSSTTEPHARHVIPHIMYALFQLNLSEPFLSPPRLNYPSKELTVR